MRTQFYDIKFLTDEEGTKDCDMLGLPSTEGIDWVTISWRVEMKLSIRAIFETSSGRGTNSEVEVG